MRKLVPLLVAALLVTIAGCDGGRPAAAPAPAPTSAPTTTPPPTGTPNPCPSSAVVPAGPKGYEVHGGGPGADLWALLFLTGPTIHAGTETKIVWRMTGSGALTIAATGPGGARIKPVWGPEGHGGSNWERPGDEWGTGWKFPAPGCWKVTATRAESGTGTVNLRVAP